MLDRINRSRKYIMKGGEIRLCGSTLLNMMLVCVVRGIKTNKKMFI
jgi:hypothetical protein